MSEGMRADLEAAAASSQRSLSEEVEARLQQSFERRSLIVDVLSLAYGPRVAGLLALIGNAMDGTGREQSFLAAWPNVDEARPSRWFEDPYSFDQAAQVVCALMNRLRPGDAADIERVEAVLPASQRNRVEKFVERFLQTARSGLPADGIEGPIPAAAIHHLLTPKSAGEKK